VQDSSTGLQARGFSSSPDPLNPGCGFNAFSGQSLHLGGTQTPEEIYIKI